MISEPSNPDPVLDALMPASTPVAGGRAVVRPLSLATFALLDKIRSPLLYGNGTGEIIDLLPTLYVLSHDAAHCLAELSGGRLDVSAIEWADQFPPTVLGEIRDAAVGQIERILYLIPPPDGETNKKKGTAGSSP
ncbi:MAG: hypothetical protein ACI4QT_07090 [Kiritimatiellia bacterium]